MNRLLPAIAILVACAGRDPRAHVLSPPLVTCTDSGDEVEVGFDYSQLSPETERGESARWVRDMRPVSHEASVVSAALSVATEWARSECYFPCPQFQMCGEVRKLDDDHASVHLRPDGIYDQMRAGHLVIAPEAQVLVNLDSGETVDSLIHHSGCRWSDPECTRASAKSR